MTLPPHRSTFHSTGEEVEYSPDCSNVAVNIQLFPMRISPLLLLRCSHTNPEQVRISSIDSLNDSLIVLIRELRLVRRRVGHHLKMRKTSAARFTIRSSTFCELPINMTVRWGEREIFFTPHSSSLFISNSNKSHPAILSFGWLLP